MKQLMVLLSFVLSHAVNMPTVAGLTGLSENSAPIMYLFDPVKMDALIENSEEHVLVSCNRSLNELESVTLKVVSVHPDIADVSFGRILSFRCDQLSASNMSQFAVRGRFLGRTVINVETLNTTQLDHSDHRLSLPLTNDSFPVVNYHVAVVRQERFIDHLFLGLVSFMVICANVGMGCKIDLAVVKEVLTKPIAPVIGFSCQYIIMPLTAFALVKVFGLSGGVALGYFASGCAPGGGSSNMYTYLLGGDVSLSVTMTLTSIIASLGMIPLWLFTLGRLISDDMQITIPFGNIMVMLACYLIPVVSGILIQRYCKRLSAAIVRSLRPIYIVFILLMFSFGVWSNLYIFRLIRPLLLLAGCLLPYIGFTLSAVTSFILRQPGARVLTIAIETGIQNTGLPIVLMKFSLPQPDADLSIVGPIVIAMFMPLPLWAAFIVTEIRRRCRRRQLSGGDHVFADNDEPTRLKAVSVSSVSAAEAALADGVAVGCDSSTQVLMNGHKAVASSADASGDVHLTSL